jgi:hypothetical protein
MNINELYQLTIWAEDNIIKVNISQKFQQLITIINNNVNNRNAAAQSFEAQKEELLKTIANINIFSLSKEQLNVLEKYNILENISSNASEQISDIFYKQSLDLATILKELQDRHRNLNQGINKITTLKNSLFEIIEEKDLSFFENEAIIKLHFENNASIDNIVELKKWSSDWYDILRGIALSKDEAPESIKVISAEKGSIIITLGIAYGLVKIISKAILKVLEIIEKSLEIAKKAHELKQLKLTNQKIIADLEKEAKDFKKNKITEMIDTFLKNNSDGEKKTAFEKSLKKLIIFTEKGGQVDCFLPSPSEDDDEIKPENIQEIKSINTNFSKIRKIETEIKKIEYFE